MQRLRAEHQVHERRALHDTRAFLAGHAAAHTDNDFRVLLLQFTPPAKLGEHLLLGLLAHRTGIEQDYIRFFHQFG